MAETTEQYRTRINQLESSILTEPYMKEMRPDIAEGIGKTGNRQADIENRQKTIEEDFVAVQTDASSTSPNGAEIVVARGDYDTLSGRLASADTQLANTTGFGVDSGLKVTKNQDFSITVESGTMYNQNKEFFFADTLISIETAVVDRYDIIYINEIGQIIYDKNTQELPNKSIWLAEIFVSASGNIVIYDKRTFRMSHKTLEGIYNVKYFGAVGDGKTDDTIAIQRAFDNAKGLLIFPQGNYKVTGYGEAAIYLKNKLNIVGWGARIRGDNLGNTTSVLKVSFEGTGDVRNWKMTDINIAINGGGLHGLLIKEGMPIITATISNCDIARNYANGGNSIYIENQLAHSLIESCTLSSIFAKCYDANEFHKNLFSGNEFAFTFDCELGVRNNVLSDNTIVNRDGHIRVKNGSNIRLKNNQMEQVTEVSQGFKKTMIWIEGVDRACDNIVIEDNNFGGGTNLDRLIYIDNADRTVITKNHMIAVNIAEIETTSKAKNTIFKPDNKVFSQLDNPRPRTAFKAEVIDNGYGTMGVLKMGTLLGLQNSWLGGDFFKDETGRVTFYNRFVAGLTAVNTVFGTLPLGFRPQRETYLNYATPTGAGILKIGTDGVLTTTTSVPSNGGVFPVSFIAGTNE